MPESRKKSTRIVKPKPFVKWAGGKGNLLSQLEALLPPDFDDQKNLTYIEPFVGGGAMLFHMLRNHKNITRVVINDINSDLIQCYKLIRNNPQELIKCLKEYESSYYAVSPDAWKQVYCAYRDSYNDNKLTPVERAAHFIFLNRTCFNGLYRVNSKGKFNVPMGRYKHPTICDEELILRDSELLKSVDMVILNKGYTVVEEQLSETHPNFIYFDPPYRPVSPTSYFKEYSKFPFGDVQQEELKAFCDKLTQKGCKLMLSNSDSKNDDGSSYFEELYEGYNFGMVYAPRAINAFVEKRVKLTEVLIRNY